MAFYNVCPKCGANLDPGERCNCTILESDAAQVTAGEFDSSVDPARKFALSY